MANIIIKCRTCGAEIPASEREPIQNLRPGQRNVAMLLADCQQCGAAWTGLLSSTDEVSAVVRSDRDRGR